MVVSVAGFIITLVLNAFFLDKYNAYGEVPIPGSGSVHLPAGQVTVSLHTLVIGGTDGGGLPVPPLGVTHHSARRRAAAGGDGKHRQHNNSQQRCARAGVERSVSTEATYNITTDGQVSGYIDPRLAFGHQSSYGYLVWVFVAMFVVGLVDLVVVDGVAGPRPSPRGPRRRIART